MWPISYHVVDKIRSLGCGSSATSTANLGDLSSHRHSLHFIYYSFETLLRRTSLFVDSELQ